MRKKIALFFILVIAFAGTGFAQPNEDKAQLERERQDIQSEIQQLQGMYNQIKGQKKISLGQLSIINRKIALQQRYIGSISRELRMIDDNIYLSNLEIFRLQKQMDTLKSQYARSVIYAYKNRSNYDYLNFIFSSSNFSDAIKRIAYLKSYRTYREKQVSNILETRQLIEKRKKQNLGRKVQKNVALQNETKEKVVLDVQRKEKDAVLSKLKTEEKDLQKQLTAKKKRTRDLNNAIVAIVRREIEIAKKEAAAEAKKNTASTPVTTPATTNPNPATTEVNTRTTAVKKSAPDYLNLNEKNIALNSSFEKNRGHLPWPVDNGVVLYHFGPNKVENTKLVFDSPGVTINTSSPGASVKAVFNGEVAVVNNNGDGSYAVVIRHGKYFTTYSNLSSVGVSRGNAITTGQVLGKVGKDDEGDGGQIDFILMVEVKNVNPESWLHR